MRIAYAIGGHRDGMTWYRIQQPLSLLDELGMASVLEINEATLEIATRAEIVVLPAVYSTLEKASFLKDDGSKVVLDICDDPFNVSPYSPSYKLWGVDEVKMKTPSGEVYEVWKDGAQGFNIEENFDRRQGLKRFLEFADLVTVPTVRLGKTLLPFCRNVRVLPDSIDLKRWKPIPIIRDLSIRRLYWGGGSSHFPDLKLIADPVRDAMERHPQCSITVMGEQFKRGALQLEQFGDRVNRIPWHPSCCYPKVIATEGIDVGLIPLQGTVFDVCKSPLKWAELGALGIPSICSGVPPYSDVYDGGNMALIGGNTREGWEEAIDYLVDNPLECNRIGAAARQMVSDRYDARKNAARWLTAYEEVLDNGVQCGDQSTPISSPALVRGGGV